MQQVLNNDYVASIGEDIGTVTCQASVRSGNFVLKDDVACTNCQRARAFFYNTCNYEVMCVSAPIGVTILDHEPFIKALHQDAGGVCDYLLCSNDTIAFVDLTCGFSDYLYEHKRDHNIVPGKRAVVRAQIGASIDRLCRVEAIAKRISFFTQKQGILGYRSIDEEMFVNQPSILTPSEEAFMKMNRELEIRRLSAPMQYGFRFTMVKYPKILQI